MKNGKKLTVRESEYIKSLKLVPANWLMSKKTLDYWLIVNRKSGLVKKIPPLKK